VHALRRVQQRFRRSDSLPVHTFNKDGTPIPTALLRCWRGHRSLRAGVGCADRRSTSQKPIAERAPLARWCIGSRRWSRDASTGRSCPVGAPDDAPQLFRLRAPTDLYRHSPGKPLARIMRFLRGHVRDAGVIPPTGCPATRGREERPGRSIMVSVQSCPHRSCPRADGGARRRRGSLGSRGDRNRAFSAAGQSVAD
jgi:hypothetical protein